MPAVAQIQMSAYVRTYTNAAHTRGYWFKVPTAFTVTHVQVPNEVSAAGHGQVVALYKWDSTNTSIPTTGNQTPEFFIEGVKPGVIIPLKTPVSYAKDEWFMVIGGMGVEATPSAPGVMNNSYGTSNLTANILGAPATLSRAGSQLNIATNNGVTTVFASASGNIARVRVWIRGGGAAEQYGMGAPGAVLDYSDPNPPIIGETAGVVVRSDDATNNASALSIGLLRTNINVPGLGTLLSQPNLVVTIDPTAIPTGATGGKLYTFPIPNNTALLGKKLTLQAGVGSPSGVVLTNGMEWVFGN